MKHCDVVVRCFSRLELLQGLAWDAAAGLTGSVEPSGFDSGYAQAIHFAVQGFEFALYGDAAERRYVIDGELTARKMVGARGAADFLAAVMGHSCGACQRELAAAKAGGGGGK